MAAPNLYKLDDGASFPTNCFPARTLFRQQEEGAGHWLVAHRASEDQKYRAGKTGNQSNTKVRPQDQLQGFQSSLPLATTKSALKENILDGFFLMKLHYVEDASDLCSVDISDKNLELAKEEDFEMFDNVAYINAAGNLLTFEPFRKFPILRELELSVNGLRNLKVNVGDFPHLEVLDLSYNNLTSDDVLSLGLCPCLRVLYLTGNGLHSLPPDVTASELNADLFPRFRSLSILMLDDNKLSHPGIFASLANLKSLKYLNLDKNGITEVPYLQKMDQYNYVCSPVSEKQGGFERLQPRQKLKHGKGLITDLKRMDKPLTIADGDVSIADTDFSPHFSLPQNDMGNIQGVPYMDGDFKLPLGLGTESVREFQPPLPELRCLSLANNKITEEEALVAVALFPSLNELVICGNPLTTQKSGDPPLLTSLLQHKLGIQIQRKRADRMEKPHVVLPVNPKRKVKTKIPKVPKQPLFLQASPDSLLFKLGYLNTKQEAAVSHKGQKVSEYKPIPPIPAPPQGKGQETQEPEQDPESYWDRMPGEEQERGKLTTDDQNVEAFFMTQVNDHPKSDKEEVLESKNQNLKHVSVPDKYKGFEELLDARPDPEFIEPVGIQQNVRALERALKNLLVYRDSKARLDCLQKPYMPREKKLGRPTTPPPRKSKAEKVEELLTKVKDRKTTSEVPLATILRDKRSQKKEYDEALGLLKELQKKYVKLHTAAVESAAQIENQNQEALHEINKRKTEINQNSSGYFQH
ncbi:X-ray radiation resistance-associated protein 1-like isoform X1 [Acipenser ruthenus]|uniref:X-ray radiation resistance-associated protein 1-like isoform X1 n=1 Tax=Acipenser ruthenus TaxID=7906 RepID=UPI0027405189|nr:X-ray radiation resistance-associated protein 1-like isoform X1 [Acipenser ruthenus]XP_058884361.1 X-ray radiation resistance-associated protein 1-like isoform X1 [Acipenser ruthenus]